MEYFKQLYEATSLNDADQLKKLLEQEIETNNLEDLLSKVCMQLQLNCVHLTDEVKLILDRKLLNLRFFYQPTEDHLSSQDICDRIGFMIKLIHDLHTCEGNDELFIVNLTFIAKQIFILKNILKLTYDRVPWEEIEFCVLSYIRTFKEQNEIVLYFRAILGKLNIINYLKVFGNNLEKLQKDVLKVKPQQLAKLPNLKRDEIMDEIIEKYPEFKLLYNDYELLRDIHSLAIMLDYATLVESVELEEEHSMLILMRALQVIGKHLKNTLESPKLSPITIDYLLTFFSSRTRDMVIELGNRLSHEQFSSKREELLESINSDFLISIKSDIGKVRSKISYILSKYKIRILKDLGEKLNSKNDEEVINELVYATKNINIGNLSKRNISELNVTQLDDLIYQFRSKINLKSGYGKFLFASIDSILKENSEEINIDHIKASENSQALIISSMSFRKFHISNSMKWGLKKVLSDFSPQNKPSTLYLIVEILISIKGLLIDQFENNEVSRLFLEIIHIVKFEMNNATWNEKFGRKLGKKENKGEIQIENSCKVSKKRKHEKLAQLREIFTGITYSKYKTNKNLQALIEILLLDLIPILKYPNLKSRNFFFDENYPTIMGLDLCDHLAHNDIIIDVLLDSDAAVFLFVETLLKVKENQNFNLEDLGHYNIKDIEKIYFNSIDISRKKLEMFTALKENNFEAFCKCLETGADIRSRDIDMSTCLHYAMNNPGTIELRKFLGKQDLSSELKNLDGRTPLHIAAFKGNLEAVEFLLNNFELEVNDVDLLNQTATHLAALSGNEHVLNILWNHGADFSKRDNFFFSPLQYGVMSGKKAVVEVFFKRNLFYKLIECCGEYTVLHIAAGDGLNKMVEYLLSRKLNVDAGHKIGFTPLHAAILNGHLEIVKILIRFGADLSYCFDGGSSAVHLACGIKGEEIIKVLIKHGADVNQTNPENGDAPIHYVTSRGYVSILETLLENDANVNLTTKCGCTPLQYAARGRHLKVVEILLNQEDIKVNSQDTMGMTPLHVAASNGDTEIASLLIANGANVNCKSVHGLNPLHLAARFDHEAMVDLLIANHISVKARTITDKLLPLHAAVESGNENIIKKLITKGSNINATTSNGSNCLHIAITNERNILDLLLHEGIKVNVKTKDNGFTPLHGAVLKNNLKMVQTLVKAGSHIDAQDDSGNTPIHLAVERESNEICLFLLENGANITLENAMGETPFLMAVKHNMIEFMQLCMSSGLIEDKVIHKSMKTALIKRNANVMKFLLEQTKLDVRKYRDSNENSLLHLAAKLGSVDLVKLLLNLGIGVDSKNKYGQTPLSLAAIGGHEDILEILLQNGAQINIQDCDGVTPLHRVSIQNHLKCVRILLDQGVDVNKPDKEKRSALEQAVVAGHLELVKLFLKMNKNLLNRKGDQNSTLLHIAAQFGRSDVVKFLLSEGADMHSNDESGLMPIHIAARDGFTDIINIFIDNGMNLDVRGKENNSLLHYAVSTGEMEVVKLLLKQGCNVNSMNDQGITPLHTAIIKGYREVVKYLLNNEAIYNIKHPLKELLKISTDEEIKNMISSAARLFSYIKADDVAKIQQAVREGVVLNCVDINKGSPLHFAVYKGNVEVVELLLRNKVLTNTIHKNGWTPLHYAAKYSNEKIVFLLLWHGAKYDIDSDNGKKPVDFADDADIRDLLRLINYCFEGIQGKNSNFINLLEQIENKDLMKAVMRAKNKHGNTLVTASIKNEFSRRTELVELFQDNFQFIIAEDFVSEGKYQEANEIYLSIYQERREIFGDDNPATLCMNSQISQMLFRLNLNEQAFKCKEETYQKLQEVLGVNHAGTLLNRTGMALILFRQGKCEESLKIFEEIHEIQKKVLPPEDENFLDTKRDMAMVLLKMKKFDRALKLNNAALKIEENKFGVSNPRTIDTKYYIAFIFELTEQYDEALKLYQEVYESRKLLLGPYHPKTLKPLKHLTNIFKIQDKYDEAFEGYKKLLEGQKHYLGHHHLDTLDTQFQIADLLLKQWQFFTAFKILKEVKERKIAIQGANHNSVLNITKLLEFIVDRYKKFGVFGSLDSLIEKLVSTMNEAAKRGDVDTIQELLGTGVDVGEKDVEGRNSLHYAVNGNNIEVVKLLLENNADITEKTNKGNTVLHTACNKGYKDITELILNSVTASKLTYLIDAATNVGKMTALHVAAKQGFPEIVRILLKKGAIYNCVNKDGKTPRDLAVDESSKNILQLIEEVFLGLKNGDLSVISKLDKLESDFLCVANARNLKNCSVLNLLISNREKGLARNFIAKITDINKQNN